MGFKLVSAVLLVALAVSGPLAPLAWAQEKLEAQMAPAPDKGDTAWQVGAAVATGVNIPGKAVLCAVGGVVGFGLLVVSFGSGYRWAGRTWEEGCGGKWVITAADMKGEPDENPFWGERPEFQR